MGRIENFRQYAADCVRQAEGEQSAEDRNILLNVALAWVRLAQQAKTGSFAEDVAAEETAAPEPKRARRPSDSPAPVA
jgi:hypothetical protein